VYEAVRNRVDATFEDLGEHEVRHVSAPVRVYRVVERESAPAPDVPAGQLALPDKPSIVVLPFDNMSPDPEQEYFADGVVEDIITELSRNKWLFVIARNSSFVYKGRAVDVKQVGRELGVRYVLEGSVRRSASRIRITGQLIDASNGSHLWADRFEGELANVFDLQDQITQSVVGSLAPRLELAEIERTKRKPTESLDAYDYYLRGMAAFHRFEKAANEQAHRPASGVRKAPVAHRQWQRALPT
jgi:adenylate cyclase